MSPATGLEEGAFRRVPILSIRVAALSFREHVELLANWASTEQAGRVVCAANVHMTVAARRDESFGALLRNADLVTPDGMPLVWLMRQRGVPNQERVAGMDLLPALCAVAERRSIPVYFLGSTPSVLTSIRQRLLQEYPKLAVAGMESPPFRAMSQPEDDALVDRINSSGARFVFVALGCPRQEWWMHEHRDRVRSVMVGLGGAFAVFAGLQPRAPRLLQRVGLEWAFRLACEPRRLWRRYLETNSLFLWYLATEWLRGRTA